MLWCKGSRPLMRCGLGVARVWPMYGYIDDNEGF